MAAAALTAVGTLVSAAGNANASSYQAQVAQNNATTANQNAVYAGHAGQVQGQEKSMQGAERQAGAKAAMAANGVDVNTGSAERVQEGGREVAQVDTENTVQNANLQAYGYRTAAVSDTAQASLDKEQASNAEISGDIGAAASLEAGATGAPTGSSNVANMFAGSGSGSGSGPFPSSYDY